MAHKAPLLQFKFHQAQCVCSGPPRSRCQAGIRCAGDLLGEMAVKCKGAGAGAGPGSLQTKMHPDTCEGQGVRQKVGWEESLTAQQFQERCG